MNEARQALESFRQDIESKEKRAVIDFDEFLNITKKEPQKVLRNVFQLFHDMVSVYIKREEDEIPDDPENIGFVKYDCSRIFVNGSDNPFFADRLFANRFARQVESLKHGSQQNRIYIYEGPHGCGKSTFLNNLLRSFEDYTNTDDGQSFEIYWDLDVDGEKAIVPCPSHDHPILIIPREYRVAFLDKLLSDKMTELKYNIAKGKEYEWLFKNDVCTICKSLFTALLDKLGSLDKVLEMVKVRHYKFDRRLGEGISVFNPGDKPISQAYLTDEQIQEKLDKIFGANLVKYVFSPHAKTNNGVYVLMDIKSDNKERLLELHNVISEGTHKINGTIEERISSLFIALMNPEDKESIREEKVESFQERIQYNKIPYVLDVPTEVQIYRSTFGEEIDLHFLPRVLENFARAIIASRMADECEPLNEWIPEMKKYDRYCDVAGRLLRMELYSGIIPPWILEEDRKKLTASIRRKLVAVGEIEGENGFSGRDSIRRFGEFFRLYGGKESLISMSNVDDFFKHRIGRDIRNKNIPKNFMASLVNWYDYVVLSEVKESLYFYNEDQISKDILNYLCAVNYDVESKVKCNWTGDEFDVTLEFLETIGTYLTGEEMDIKRALNYAQEIQRRYVEVVARSEKEQITETELYQELFASYVRNLKEKMLEPFLKSDNFREAVKCFGSDEFKTFHIRLKEHVEYMLDNLVKKFGYTEQGAKEICLYVIGQKLVEKFS